MHPHLSKKQLNLPIHIDHTLSFENFYSEGIEHALVITKLLEACISNRFHHILMGQHGHGKSHLLEACLQRSSYTVSFCCTKLHTLQPELLTDLEHHNLYIDNIDHLAGKKAWEQALFKLFSLNPQLNFLATTSRPIQQCHFVLPELASRLQGFCTLSIPPLNEQEQLKAMQLRAKKRGLPLHNDIIRWLQKNIPRDNHSIFRALHLIDQACLRQKSKVNMALVKNILEQEKIFLPLEALPQDSSATTSKIDHGE